MKVVLFCGGLGTRLREFSETIPKPLVPIGYRPLLWHLMRYYAHYGHDEFILCLGYRADLIKEFFLGYNEALFSDVRVSDGGQRIEYLEDDVQNWQVTLVDTGENANIGQRLVAVAPYLEDEEMFLANYSDGLSDLALDDYIEDFAVSGSIARFLSVRPSHSFHSVVVGDEGIVSEIAPAQRTDLWINGGFFVFRREIFDYIKSGEELVEEPFQRLIREQRLSTRQHDGFWACIDTLKEKVAFDTMYAKGDTPWMVWSHRT
jgi:glucose-1-phosphate cytidylyltransferase